MTTILAGIAQWINSWVKGYLQVVISTWSCSNTVNNDFAVRRHFQSSSNYPLNYLLKSSNFWSGEMYYTSAGYVNHVARSFSTTLTSKYQTCRYLAEVTKSGAIWKGLVDNYIVTSALPPRLERPLALHSSTELENLLLRWKSADCALSSDTSQPSRERTFVGVKAKLVHLVKGGRWLLVTERTGAVTYYDLDAETISGVQLIPDQIKFTDGSQVTMTIEHDMNSPFLEFSIAFCCESDDAFEIESHSFPRRGCLCSIWRVESASDDMQHVVGLTATQLASFPFHLAIRQVPKLSLLGPNLAFIGNTGRYHLFVINWRQAQRNPLKYPFRVVGQAAFRVSVCLLFHWVSFTELYRQAFIHLLPKGKLLTTLRTDYTLYDYLSTAEVTNIPDPFPSSFPSVWHIEGPNCDMSSSCFINKTKASIVVAEMLSISALTFDYSSLSSAPPSVAVIARGRPTIFTEPRIYLGYKRTVIIAYPGEIKVLAYSSFAPCTKLVAPRQKGRLNIPDGLCPIVDEDIGRVVCRVYSTIEREPETHTVFALADFARTLSQ